MGKRGGGRGRDRRTECDTLPEKEGKKEGGRDMDG